MIFGAVILLLAVVWGIRRPTQNTTPEPGVPSSPTPIPISLYPLPPVSPAGENQATVFTMGFSPKDEEKTAKAYRATFPDPYGAAERLASLLLPGSTTTQDSGVRYWKSDVAQVTGQTAPPRISYQVFTLPVQKTEGVSDARAEEIARGTAATLGVMSEEYTLVQPISRRFDGSLTHPEEGEIEGGLTKIGLSFALDGLPIIDNTGGALLFSVTLDNTGKLVGLSSAVPPAVTPIGLVPLIPLGQAVTALTSNKGVLTSAQYDRVDVGASLIRPNIKAATITSVARKYVWNDRSRTIVPVYVFEGYSDEDAQNGRIKLTYLVTAAY